MKNNIGNFIGYHSEWNLGSPGGWDYQRMTQILGRMVWERVKSLTEIDLDLDFTHPILDPVPGFVEMLLRAHKRRFGRQEPFIVLVAEEETLESVIENINLADHLDNMEGVKARLIAPHQLELKGNRITVEGRGVTVIFLDFNNNVLDDIGKSHNTDAIFAGIKEGIVVNPRGMEPVGAKGVFEVVTGEFRRRFSETTVLRTPWTRRFFKRKTEGPESEEIDDLVEWVRERFNSVVLKPEHGYSGKGIYVGCMREDRDKDIEDALNRGDYIVQSFVPLELWSEQYISVDHGTRELKLETKQTDFRCLITDTGLIGFVGRFGGVPTNVGSGGGTQAIAFLRSEINIKEARARINDTIISLGYETIGEIQSAVEKRAKEMGHTYLLGPIPVALNPRILSYGHLSYMKNYSKNLWEDAILLEKWWRDGRLDHIVDLNGMEEQVARMQPWKGSPALIASDGLYSFD